MWVQSLGREDPLEESMATHCSILAWKIPWTEEPGRLHTVHGVTKSQTGLRRLSMHAVFYFYFSFPPIRIQVSGGQPPIVVLSACALVSLCSRSVTKCV